MQWLVALVFSLSAHAALVPCGQHPFELSHPELLWKQFSLIQVRSKLADVDGVICVGKVPYSPEASWVTYRDSDNRTQVLKTVLELSEFQVLITSSELPPGISNVVRPGGLVSLKIGEGVVESERNVTVYPVAVRFHRNLARTSSVDIRELEFQAELNFEADVALPARGAKNFNILKLFIGAIPPRMEQVVLKQDELMIDSFFTSTLQRVGELN